MALGKAWIDCTKCSPECNDGRTERERVSQKTDGYPKITRGMTTQPHAKKTSQKVQLSMRDGIRNGFFTGDNDQEFCRNRALVDAVVEKIDAFDQRIAFMKGVFAMPFNRDRDLPGEDITEKGNRMGVPAGLFTGWDRDNQYGDFSRMCLGVFNGLSGSVGRGAQERSDLHIVVIVGLGRAGLKMW